jgi:hypothetical protein
LTFCELDWTRDTEKPGIAVFWVGKYQYESEWTSGEVLLQCGWTDQGPGWNRGNDNCSVSQSRVHSLLMPRILQSRVPQSLDWRIGTRTLLGVLRPLAYPEPCHQHPKVSSLQMACHEAFGPGALSLLQAHTQVLSSLENPSTGAYTKLSRRLGSVFTGGRTDMGRWQVFLTASPFSAGGSGRAKGWDQSPGIQASSKGDTEYERRHHHFAILFLVLIV